MKRRCDTCRFSVTEAVPHCRLTLNAVDGGSSAFPVIRPDFWCFSYKRSWWRWLKRFLRFGSYFRHDVPHS